jgi:hypothetical protein
VFRGRERDLGLDAVPELRRRWSLPPLLRDRRDLFDVASPMTYPVKLSSAEPTERCELDRLYDGRRRGERDESTLASLELTERLGDGDSPRPCREDDGSPRK